MVIYCSAGTHADGWQKVPVGVLWLLTILFHLLVWTVDAQTLPLERIKLPPGFEISLYASGVENARSMTLSPNGTVFVGTRSAGKVYAVVDRNGDAKADEVITLARGLNSPNGVAFRDGALYVAEINRCYASMISNASHQFVTTGGGE